MRFFIKKKRIGVVAIQKIPVLLFYGIFFGIFCVRLRNSLEFMRLFSQNNLICKSQNYFKINTYMIYLNNKIFHLSSMLLR